MHKTLISLTIMLAFLSADVYLCYLIADKGIDSAWMGAITFSVFLVFWLCCKYVFRDYYDVDCRRNFVPDVEALKNSPVDYNGLRLNGIGTSVFGTFGENSGYHRTYLCFGLLWFFPVIPAGCIVRGKSNVSRAFAGINSEFPVLGLSQWYPLEVAVVMGRPWALLGLVYTLFNI